jgi:hypothetical protein
MAEVRKMDLDEAENNNNVGWIKPYESMTKEERKEDQTLRTSQWYPNFFRVLDSRLKDFYLQNPGQTHFPAVDLAAGEAVSTLLYGLRYRRPKFDATLDWYPTEWKGKQGGHNHNHDPLNDELRVSLKLMQTKADEENYLFTDSNGKNVFRKDKVVMEGLKEQTKFNGIIGSARNPDPYDEGRFGVKVEGEEQLLSIRKEHLTRAGGGERPGFFKDLLDRSCEINMLEHDTWDNLNEIYGKTALVSCTYLVCSVGEDTPNIWQDSLELASKLLMPGGYLIQYDTVKYGGYGDASIMQKYIAKNQLGLEMEIRSEPVEDGTNHGTIFMILWRKVATGKVDGFTMKRD